MNTTPPIQQARQLLKTVFGYEEFRPLQEACILSVLEKKDTLLVMPTGAGKSLCYQIPALIFDGLTVVISPLISLMADQVRQLKAWGVEAVVLNSSLSREDYEENIFSIKSGKTKILFLAPETLLKPEILKLLLRCPVRLFTIDEAHCISDWGHDFRPEYRKIFQIRSRFPQAACLAITATATPRVCRDIRENLNIDAADQRVASFNRPNLFYEVIPRADPLNQTIDFLKRFPGQSGIIYCFSRRQTEELTQALTEKGYQARPYHAGLSSELRSENQDLFIRDDVQIIVATIAFGMGINKPNVRFVVHYDLPKNIESYYQETGRAGRDGLPAYCLLLFGYGSIHNIRYLIDKKANEAEKRVAALHLDAMIRYAETQGCRRIPLITYFGETYDIETCGNCDNCASPKESTFDITEAARKLMACIAATRQKFGGAHLIDVLRGSESEKVTRFNHQALPVYGTGKEYSVKQWKSIASQLIQKDLIKQDHDAYGALKLTAKSAGVLQERAQVFGFTPPEEQRSKAVKKESGKAFDEALFQLLRKKRKELADRSQLPPYIIFSDKSLMDMAACIPKTPQDFLDIHGVGSKKLESYGDIFLGVIKDYTAK